MDNFTLAERLFNAIQQGSGISIDLAGREPTSGYMVSETWAECRVPRRIVCVNLIVAWLDALRLDTLDFRYRYLGAWCDGEHVYLDVSQNVTNRDDAIDLGEARSQKAIWDVVRACEIRLIP